VEVIFDDLEDEAMVGPILEADEEQLVLHEGDENGSEVSFPSQQCLQNALHHWQSLQMTLLVRGVVACLVWICPSNEGYFGQACKAMISE
jgi:predicted mannosyl-3-phosphoglycerate phosphatase (HAD superfamily)